MNPSSIPWWAWLMLAVIFYIAQIVMSPSTDKGSSGAWMVRGIFTAATFLCAAIAVIRFVKWVWVR